MDVKKLGGVQKIVKSYLIEVPKTKFFSLEA